MSIREVSQRIPAALWNALQDVCYAQDVQFIKDVAKIIGKDAAEIRRRIMGPRGELTTLLADSDPWWIGTQCNLMERDSCGLWKRCCRGAESNGYCWDHRNFTNSTQKLRRRDDSHFEGLVRRHPIRFQGEIVWVCEKGTVLGADGLRTDIIIDVKNCIATYI